MGWIKVTLTNENDPVASQGASGVLHVRLDHIGAVLPEKADEEQYVLLVQGAWLRVTLDSAAKSKLGRALGVPIGP